MGWNSWNCFRCEIDEVQIRAVADALVTSGLRDAGYEYLNLDDGWMARERDADGALQADPDRFPSGIAALAGYVHARGLKLGIYEDAGALTCGGYPGSSGHFEQDARTFAGWGVDLLKFDWCHTGPGDEPRARYAEMRAALEATGRPIVLSACDWGIDEPWRWGPEVASLVRTTGDITDSWDSVLNLLDQSAAIAAHGGPGHWLDPDMLEVGNGGMTLDEYRAHFSLWSMLAAPLIAGNDVRSMSDDVRDILVNRDVIAVDQDPLGRPARRLWQAHDCEAWTRELAGGDVAVLLLNRGLSSRRIAVEAADAGLGAGRHAVRDLWTGAEAAAEGTLDALVAPHGAALLRVRAGGDDGLDARTVPELSPTLFPAGEARRTTITWHGGSPAAAELRAPAGWDVAAGDGGTWLVRPPAGTPPGAYALTLAGDAPVTVVVPPPVPQGEVFLSEHPWLAAVNGAWSGWYPEIRRDRAIRGRTLSLRGRSYARGLGVHAFSHIWYHLGGACRRFQADVGVDDHLDEAPPFSAGTLAAGTVVFEVWGDGILLHRTSVLTREDPVVELDVDVSGVEVLRLTVSDGGDGTYRDYADWAGARVR